MAALVGFSSPEDASDRIDEVQNDLDKVNAHLLAAARAIDPSHTPMVISPPPPSPLPPPPPSPPPPPPLTLAAAARATPEVAVEATARAAGGAAATATAATPAVAAAATATATASAATPPPRPAAATTTAATTAAAATAAVPARTGAAPSLATRCHKDCGKRGTCNEALGRCDCPPFYGGDDCSQPLFPSCADQWGLKPEVAVCGIHIQPAFPTTCECMWECHSLALDARQECIVEPKPGQSMADAQREVKQRMGWMPVIANETELARTRADAKTSREQGLCSGRGVKSVQLPYEFYPKTGEIREGINQRLVPQCRCFPGYTGPNCEIRMDDVAHMHKCFNGCSGKGACEHNVCRCQPGSYGIDCSLGLGDPPRNVPGVPPSPAALRAAASRKANGGEAPRPRIYVYDMPPRFTSWLGAFRRGDWTRDHWYGVDVILHQQLLRSRYRTLDPEDADYFYIPLHLSLGFYSHRYYFKHFTAPAAKPLRDAINYVKSTWPYFNRKGGKDHIMVMTQDQGNRFVRQTVPEANPLILIHHWGAPRSCIVDGSGQGDHMVAHDITVPPFHGEQVRLNRWLPPSIKGGDAMSRCLLRFGPGAPQCTQPAILPEALKQGPSESDFRQLLFFSGKMNLNWGRAYALGVRQAIYRAHRNASGFLISTFDNGVFEKIPFEKHVENYAASKFCLAPAGYGFSSRQYECVLVGCVPVIIQDDVEMAFEEVLPWRRFALRLNFSDIPILPQLLQRIPASHVAKLRRGLGCIWPRMLWLTPGLYNSASVDAAETVAAARQYDAFETTMLTLRNRLPGASGGEGLRSSEPPPLAPARARAAAAG